MVAFIITEEGIVEKGMTTTTMVGRTGWTKTEEAVVCSRFSSRKRKRDGGEGSTVAIVPTLEPFDVYLEHK